MDSIVSLVSWALKAICSLAFLIYGQNLPCYKLKHFLTIENHCGWLRETLAPEMEMKDLPICTAFFYSDYKPQMSITMAEDFWPFYYQTKTHKY